MKKTVYICDNCGRQFDKKPNGNIFWIHNWGEKLQSLRLTINTQLYEKGKGTTSDEINADFCSDCITNILKTVLWGVKKVKSNDTK